MRSRRDCFVLKWVSCCCASEGSLCSFSWYMGYAEESQFAEIPSPIDCSILGFSWSFPVQVVASTLPALHCKHGSNGLGGLGGSLTQLPKNPDAFTEQSTCRKTRCPKEFVHREGKTKNRSRKYSHIWRNEAKGTYKLDRCHAGSPWPRPAALRPVTVRAKTQDHECANPSTWHTFSLILSLSFHFTLTAISNNDYHNRMRVFLCCSEVLWQLTWV